MARGDGLYGGQMKDRPTGTIGKCPRCHAAGDYLHVLRIGRSGKTVTMMCSNCGKPWTAVN